MPLRPLLPALDKPVSTVPGLAPSAKRNPKRSQVPAACEPCRIRKSKCTGERPQCSVCIKRSTACEYLTSSTETRPQALKRKYQSLVEQKNQLTPHEELFVLMKSMSRVEADDIVQRIRLGHDVDQILKHVKDGNLLLQLRLIPELSFRYELPYISAMPESLLSHDNPYVDSMIYEAASLRLGRGELNNTELDQYQSWYVKPYHAADLVEPRLEQVKPSLWTTVSKDDVLMRLLLASYFKHDYQIFTIFQKDYFLEDMASRNQDCCSSLLVNAVLAYACLCDTKLPDRYQYWNPTNLSYRFLAEAKRLWELYANEGVNCTLPTVEGAMLINNVCNLSGLDKIGDNYGLQGVALAHQIKLFDGNAHVESKRLQNAMNFAAWGIFNLQSQLSWNFYRSPVIPRPPSEPLPDASKDQAWFGEILIKYPLDEHTMPGYFGQTFASTCKCRVIINEICKESFGNNKLESSTAKGFVLRILEWYSTLPEMLQPKRIVLPAHFVLHLDYHILLLVLLQTFANEDWSPDPSPHDILAQANVSLQTLMRLYYVRHGYQTSNGYLVSPLAKLAFTSMDKIAKCATENTSAQNNQLELARSTLFLAVEWLYHQGCSFFLARSIYHLVMNQMSTEESVLLQRIFQPGADGEEIHDSQQDELRNIQAQWIPAIVSLSDDPETQRLNKLIEQYANASIQDQ